MKKILFICIILLALSLRIFRLGVDPPSLDWDEVSIGYNAYSILHTGKDEYGFFLPMNLASFGDYKPAAYTYITIPAIAIFGLTEFAVRLPSAIVGLLTVVFSYYLVKRLFYEFRHRDIYALLTALFFAISPWHIQFSRVAFEANLGLFWSILGILFILHAIQGKKIAFLVATLAFSIALYSYHSTRVFVPLMVAGLAFYFRSSLLKQKRWFFINLLVGIVLIIPLAKVFMQPQIQARFRSVSEMKADDRLAKEIIRMRIDRKRHDKVGSFLHNRRFTYIRTIIGGYLDHWNSSFLFVKGDQNPRHSPPGMGMLYLWDLPFVLLGLLVLFSLKHLSRFVLLLWFLLVPIAASVTEATPHAVRTLLYLPTYQIFVALGVVLFYKHYAKTREKILRFLLLLMMVFLLMTNIFYYMNIYFIHMPIETSLYWQYGYKQLVYALRGRINRFDHIVVTNTYDQPYIYFLFYLPIDPTWYQNQWRQKAPLSERISQNMRSFGKYEFREINWSKDRYMKNTILIVAPDAEDNPPESDLANAEKINFLDGSVAFYIIKR